MSGAKQTGVISQREAIDRVAETIAKNSKGRTTHAQARETVRKAVLKHERNVDNNHR